MVGCLEHFHNIWDNPSHWLSYFSIWLKAPTRDTWWLIPLSKWVITPVISGLSLLIPCITGVITHLLSGMSHQVHIFTWPWIPPVASEIPLFFAHRGLDGLFRQGKSMARRLELAGLSHGRPGPATWLDLTRSAGDLWGSWYQDVPSGYVKIAIEHGHRNSGFSHCLC